MKSWQTLTVYLKATTGKNGTFHFDPKTHVGIRDSKGNVSIFAKNEKSLGTVNRRLYEFYSNRRYGEAKHHKSKVVKPFKATVLSVPRREPEFHPYVKDFLKER